MEKKLLILTEAGEGVGYGHLTRTLAIASEFIKRGFSVRYLLNDTGKFHFDSSIIETGNWIDENFIEMADLPNYDYVIFDSYLASIELMKRYSEFAKISFAIDDYNRICYPVDVVINPNLFFDQIDYSNQNAKLIGGKDFIILREKFSQNTSKLQPRQVVQNVLLTVGGSDSHNVIPRLCNILSESYQFSIEAICPDNIKREKLKLAFPAINFCPTLSEEEVFTKYSNSDLVVSACGQTLHELASLGKATVGFSIGEDQLLNQEFYFRNGFLNSKFDFKDENFEDSILHSINQLLPLESRIQVFNICQSLISKNGVNNIVNQIIKL